MQISELYDLIVKKQDSKGYNGAISVRPVRVETEDGDALYTVTGMVYDEVLNCYIIKAGVSE